TSALSAGNDYPHVRWTVHLGTPPRGGNPLPTVGKSWARREAGLVCHHPHKLLVYRPKRNGRAAGQRRDDSACIQEGGVASAGMHPILTCHIQRRPRLLMPPI